MVKKMGDKAPQILGVCLDSKDSEPNADYVRNLSERREARLPPRTLLGAKGPEPRLGFSESFPTL
jgi:hypothetical protein